MVGWFFLGGPVVGFFCRDGVSFEALFRAGVVGGFCDGVFAGCPFQKF